MISILSITAPIYALIALGYLSVRRGWFTKPEMRVLGRFVIQLALPTLVFQALAQRRIGEIFNAGYLAAYALGSLVLMAGASLYARRRLRRGSGFSALFGMGTSFSNSGFVGYPIVAQLLGPSAAIGLALCMLSKT
jgi:malonate transporter and related proteins